MDWIQQWQSKLNKQNGVAPLVRTGGSRHTGLAAPPHRNIQSWPRTSEEAADLTEEQFRYLMIGLNPLNPKVREVTPQKPT